VIDEKGRLWGKVNIIDLAIVLVVVAGLLFYVAGRSLNKAVPTTEVTMVLESEPLYPGSGEDIKPGDKIDLFNGSTNLELGTVEQIEFSPYPNRATQDGKVLVAPDPVQRLARLRVTGKAVIGKNVVTINNQVVMVGSRFTIRSKRSQFLVAVRELTVKGPEGAK
jgi:hypothetical protein